MPLPKLHTRKITFTLFYIQANKMCLQIISISQSWEAQ